jgi:cytochrome c553
MQRVAEFYSGLARPGPPPNRARADATAVERGRTIANDGVPAERIPPCVTCHGADALPHYPRLTGQNIPYMIARLRHWRHGLSFGTETDAIMAPIAQLLNAQQSADVATYFSTLPIDSAGLRQ